MSIWSVLFVLPPHEYEKKHDYDFENHLSRDFPRVFFHVLGFLLTLLLIVQEIWDYYLSNKKHNRWRVWREKELQKVRIGVNGTRFLVATKRLNKRVCLSVCPSVRRYVMLAITLSHYHSQRR